MRKGAYKDNMKRITEKETSKAKPMERGTGREQAE